MTDLRAAAEIALKVLERASDAGYSIECEEAITALRQALAQPVVDRRLKVKLGRQYGRDLNGHWFYLQPADECADQALTTHSGYTAPPKPEQDSISTNDHLCAMLRQVHDVLACTALPMKRPWVGLTDDEIEDTWGNTPMMLNARDGGARRVFARAIEAKLKEKNDAV